MEEVSPRTSPESSRRGAEDRRPRPHLSAALKERLKRSKRSFVSPLSVAKRLCVDDSEEHDGGHVLADSKQQPVELDRREVSDGSAGRGTRTATSLPPEDIVEALRREVKERVEKLRRLKMVKMYRSKNDLKQLQTLVGKWRTCAQAALFELQSEVRLDGRKADLSELIDHFGLEDRILHFDRVEEDFTKT